MAEDITLRLSLEGNVTLPLLAEAIRGLSDLVVAVGKEFGAEDATWIVEELDAGSASATIRGESAQRQVLTDTAIAVVRTTELVAQGLDEAVPKPAARSARRLTSVVNGYIPSLSLQTGEDVVTVVSGPNRTVERQRQVSAWGSLVGVVQTLSQARGLHFRMTEELHGQSVAGRFGADLSEDMREMWGRRAVIEGLITRDARTGLPLTITDVRRVRLAPESKPGAFIRARGVLTFTPENESAETIIRRLRDAS